VNKLRFVHLSDIHFGQEVDGSRPEHDDIRSALLRDCKKRADDLGNAHGILVTGDIAYSGKRSEYDRAGIWLESIAEAVGCHKIAIHTIPGNHDVDVSKVDYIVEMLQRDLRQASALNVQEILTKIVPDDAETSPLLDKLAEYRIFASRYNSDFLSVATPISEKEVKFPSGHILRFRGLTSVQVSDLSDSNFRGHMVLGNRQYIFEPQENIEYVAMSHHPMDWFKDRAQAHQYLVARARVWLLGHEHLSAHRRIEEHGHEYVVIDAGATNPPGGGERQPYTYNWLEFELRAVDQRMDMVVTIHPRVWIPQSTEFDADKNRIAVGTSNPVTIKCSNYRTLSEVHAPVAETAQSIPVSVSEGSAPAVEDEEKFAKLLYYFWRYLDWRERLSVLVKVDVLPSSPDQPIPQLLERNALAAARKQKKLGAVWNEIMRNVPESKREPNPFETNGEANA
jgi:hypothetical protein